MENLIFSLNATIPVFLMMMLGLFFKKLGWMDEEFADKMNKFVFKVPLPVLLFEQLATVDFADAWSWKFVLFCFGVTVVSIGLAIGLSCLWKDRSIRGEFIQASYRSSAALLGMAFIQNIYGNAGMAPLMIIASVPLYNAMAVFVLTVFQPQKEQKAGADLWKKTLRGIVTNPIILGILAGLLWSALRLPVPFIMGKVLSNVGGVATPLGLMAMGAGFDIRKARKTGRPAVAAALMKLCGYVTLFLPVAVLLGFRREELVAILIMLGSATTVSSYVMARNMGHEGSLTSGTVMLTTLLSAFTLTGWLYILRCFLLV